MKNKKKKTEKCKATGHDFQYQMMAEEGYMGWHTRRILYCRKCGKIKEINL